MPLSDQAGVLYTDHRHLRGAAPVASLWSYANCARTPERRPVVVNANGSRGFWLDRSDPLLNTILPGTTVSLIVNRGDAWAAGRSLATSVLLPRICVVGPFTRPRILHVGRSVDAAGVVIPVVMTFSLFGVPASELVDQIVDLQDLWGQDPVERIGTAMAGLSTEECVALLRDEVVTRLGRIDSGDTIALGRHARHPTQRRHRNGRSTGTAPWDEPRAANYSRDGLPPRPACRQNCSRESRASRASCACSGPRTCRSGLHERRPPVLRPGAHDQPIPRVCGRVAHRVLPATRRRGCAHRHRASRPAE